MFRGFAGSPGLWEASALCVCGTGLEWWSFEEMEQRLGDASSLIFLALMCLTVLSLKLPT